MKNIFSYITHFILLITVFLFPLFFLPLTQEYFITNKFYLLTVVSLLLVSLSIIKFLLNKKINWQKTPFDTGFFLLLLTLALSIIISSPNKTQALLNQNFGFVMMLVLLILYYYLIKIPLHINFKKTNKLIAFFSQLTALEVASFSSVILGIITIVFFFNPLKNIGLPQALEFMKMPGFTPLGSQLDLALFLGFFLIIQAAQAITQKDSVKSLKSILSKGFSIVSTLITLAALTLTIIFILKPSSNTILPPFNLSWYSAVEILKNPLTALFGIGVDNYSAIFTKVKDAGYSLSNLWQINSFSVSRSTLLHIFTETGILGFTAFTLLIINLIREILKIKTNETKIILLIIIGYLLVVILFFPPSLPVFFLLILTFTLIGKTSDESIQKDLDTKKTNFVLDTYYILPLYIAAVILSTIVIGASFYFLSRAYAAEIYFKKSLDGIMGNNINKLYNNQRQAIQLNPYIERFRTNFSQTNFWIANNLASKKKENITDQDKKTISDTVQTAIAEAKASVTLNPQRASSWAALAEIYRNVLNVAQGADAWSISAYQRAIVADPQNPLYRFSLGSVYFSLNNFTDATRLFEQSAAIKPDWANAHYNLAWSSYKTSDFQRAVIEMQNALNLIDPKKANTDYEKAKKDLEEFKKKLPPSAQEATKGAQIQQEPSQLNLPTPNPATFSPRIELPQEASPEAR